MGLSACFIVGDVGAVEVVEGDLAPLGVLFHHYVYYDGEERIVNEPINRIGIHIQYDASDNKTIHMWIIHTTFGCESI